MQFKLKHEFKPKTLPVLIDLEKFLGYFYFHRQNPTWFSLNKKFLKLVQKNYKSIATVNK